ncbi:transposase, partial [Pseudanabaena mucicola]
MDRKFLDLYSDYLISSFEKVTATGLSELLEGELSHDQITSRLRQCTGASVELWQLVKPTIRKYESEEGVLIFDDTLEPKPYSDENTIVGWYFDHSHNRSIKGINILNCIYHNQDISLPVAYEIVHKSKEVTDPKTGKVKFVSEESKNEMMRKMLHVCCQNRLKFSYVLTDSWFSSKENMQYIKQRVKKDFIMAVKGNRLAICADDKSQG